MRRRAMNRQQLLPVLGCAVAGAAAGAALAALLSEVVGHTLLPMALAACGGEVLGAVAGLGLTRLPQRPTSAPTVPAPGPAEAAGLQIPVLGVVRQGSAASYKHLTGELTPQDPYVVLADQVIPRLKSGRVVALSAAAVSDPHDEVLDGLALAFRARGQLLLTAPPVLSDEAQRLMRLVDDAILVGSAGPRLQKDLRTARVALVLASTVPLGVVLVQP